MLDVQEIKEQIERLNLDFEKVELNEDGTINYYGRVSSFKILNLQKYEDISIKFKHIDVIDVDYYEVENLKGLESVESVIDLILYDSNITTTEHLSSLKTVKGIIKVYYCDFVTNIDNLKKFKNLEVVDCPKLGFTRYPLMKRFKTSMFYRRVFIETGLVNIFKDI